MSELKKLAIMPIVAKQRVLHTQRPSMVEMALENGPDILTDTSSDTSSDESLADGVPKLFNSSKRPELSFGPWLSRKPIPMATGSASKTRRNGPHAALGGQLGIKQIVVAQPGEVKPDYVSSIFKEI